VLKYLAEIEFAIMTTDALVVVAVANHDEC